MGEGCKVRGFVAGKDWKVYQVRVTFLPSFIHFYARPLILLAGLLPPLGHNLPLCGDFLRVHVVDIPANGRLPNDTTLGSSWGLSWDMP